MSNLNEPFCHKENGEGDIAMGQIVAPPTACSMTSTQLQEMLEKSEYGMNRGVYLCYFEDGMPPKCVSCGRTIGEHPTTYGGGGGGNTTVIQLGSNVQLGGNVVFGHMNQELDSINFDEEYYHEHYYGLDKEFLPDLDVSKQDIERLEVFLEHYCPQHSKKLYSILQFHEHGLPELFRCLVKMFGPEPNLQKAKQKKKQKRKQQLQESALLGIEPIDLTDVEYGGSTLPTATDASKDDVNRLEVFIMKYCPDHIDKVYNILFVHSGEWDTLFKRLVLTYGPEPPRERIPDDPTCFLCEDREKIKEHAVTRFQFPLQEVDEPLNGMDAHTYGWWYVDRAQCDECGLVQHATHTGMSAEEKAEVNNFRREHPNIKFFGCSATTYTSCYRKGGGKRSKGAPVRFKCSRVVCSECVEKGRHLREHSRFHHDEPEWRTSLFGCLSSPRITCNAMACYYCCEHPSTLWEGNLDLYKRTSLERFSRQQSGIFCIACLGWWFFIEVLLADLACMNVPRITQHEHDVRVRFGVEEHSIAAKVFCRHCVYIRLVREAEARGYKQPTCCTSPDDFDAIEDGYPAPPSRKPISDFEGAGLDAPPVASII